MNKAEKLAYFFESRDLRSVFGDWPEDIGLVLCMDEDGGCEMLLHHVDEGRSVIRKVAGVLGRPLGQFAVVPPVEGHPTRRVLFSDEQKLLSLVAAETELPEMAADYLMNFRYEAERRRQRGERIEPKVAPEPKEAKPSRISSSAAQRSRWRSETAKPWRPRFHLTEVREKGDSKLPGGYLSADAARDEECRFADGVLSLSKRGVRLVISPDDVTMRTPSVRVVDVGFRDDFSRFVLPRDIAEGWLPGDPLVIDMPVELFPAGLQQRFALAPRVADLTITKHGVFVTPGAEMASPPAVATPATEPEAPAVPAAVAAPRKRPLLTPFRLALVALTGVGLMTGSVMRAVDLSGDPAPSAQVRQAER